MYGVGHGKATVEERKGSVGGVGSNEWWDRSYFPGMSGKEPVISRLDSNAMVDANGAIPDVRVADGNYQHSGIPEGWTMQVYRVFHQGTDENGEPYGFADTDDLVRVYKDENGKLRGFDNNIQSFESDDENEIDKRIRNYLGNDGFMSLEKTWANPGSRRI